MFPLRKHFKDHSRQVYIPLGLLLGSGVLLSSGIFLGLTQFISGGVSFLFSLFFLEFSYPKSFSNITYRYLKFKKMSTFDKKEYLSQLIEHCLKMDRAHYLNEYIEKLPKVFKTNPKYRHAIFCYIDETLIINQLPYWEELVMESYINYPSLKEISIYELEHSFDSPKNRYFSQSRGMIFNFTKLLERPDLITAAKQIEFNTFIESGKVYR